MIDDLDFDVRSTLSKQDELANYISRATHLLSKREVATALQSAYIDKPVINKDIYIMILADDPTLKDMKLLKEVEVDIIYDLRNTFLNIGDLSIPVLSLYLTESSHNKIVLLIKEQLAVKFEMCLLAFFNQFSIITKGEIKVIVSPLTGGDVNHKTSEAKRDQALEIKHAEGFENTLVKKTDELVPIKSSEQIDQPEPPDNEDDEVD